MMWSRSASHSAILKTAGSQPLAPALCCLETCIPMNAHRIHVGCATPGIQSGVFIQWTCLLQVNESQTVIYWFMLQVYKIQSLKACKVISSGQKSHSHRDSPGPSATYQIRSPWVSDTGLPLRETDLRGFYIYRLHKANNFHSPRTSLQSSKKKKNYFASSNQEKLVNIHCWGLAHGVRMRA